MSKLDAEMDEKLKQLGDHVSAARPDAVLAVKISHDELTVEARAEAVLDLVRYLRDDPECAFEILVDLCGADYPEREKRFDVVYHLLSVSRNQRIRVKIATDEATPVASLVPLYSSANWFERECWDMYGVMFADHPDLRRILTDYGFEGHPLRKDFPLTGHVEVRYDEEEKRVVYEPVTLTQEFRRFDFMSPWEGAEYVLPGDEKAKGSA